MAIETQDLVNAVKKIMGPIFEASNLHFRKQSSTFLWSKLIGPNGEYTAAIVFEKHRPSPEDKRYTFRIHVSDNDIFDVRAYRENYLPSKEVRKNLNIKYGILERLSNYDWYKYPDSLQGKEEYLQMYANELILKLEEYIPKGIKWLNR
jgi:hypothetical protein